MRSDAASPITMDGGMIEVQKSPVIQPASPAAEVIKEGKEACPKEHHEEGVYEEDLEEEEVSDEEVSATVQSFLRLIDTN